MKVHLLPTLSTKHTKAIYNSPNLDLYPEACYLSSGFELNSEIIRWSAAGSELITEIKLMHL